MSTIVCITNLDPSTTRSELLCAVNVFNHAYFTALASHLPGATYHCNPRPLSIAHVIGAAFIELQTPMDAHRAVQAINGQCINGHQVEAEICDLSAVFGEGDDGMSIGTASSATRSVRRRRNAPVIGDPGFLLPGVVREYLGGAARSRSRKRCRDDNDPATTVPHETGSLKSPVYDATPSWAEDLEFNLESLNKQQQHVQIPNRTDGVVTRSMARAMTGRQAVATRASARQTASSAERPKMNLRKRQAARDGGRAERRRSARLRDKMARLNI